MLKTVRAYGRAGRRARRRIWVTTLSGAPWLLLIGLVAVWALLEPALTQTNDHELNCRYAQQQQGAANSPSLRVLLCETGHSEIEEYPAYTAIKRGEADALFPALRHWLNGIVRDPVSLFTAILALSTIFLWLTFPGRHEPIVDHQTFDAAQSQLAANTRRRREYVSRADRMLLRGLVFDADGQPMAPIISKKQKRLYKYYGSAPLLRADMSEDRDDAIRRIPAAALESLVTHMVAKLQVTPDDEGPGSRLRALIGRVEVHSASVHLVIRIRALPGMPTLRSAMETLQKLLDPGEHALVDPSHAGLIRVILPVRLVVWGGRTWANGSDGRPFLAARAPDARMVKGLRSGHAVLKACGISPGSLDPADWKHARAPKTGRERRLAELAFLAPDIQRAMMRGEVAKPWDDADWRLIPLSWSDQRTMFLALSEGVLGRSPSQTRITTGLVYFSD